MDKETKEKIVNLLVSRVNPLKCPMCGLGIFTILDGYVVNSITHDDKTIVLGGNTIKSAVIVCNNCGFTSLHNLKALGI